MSFSQFLSILRARKALFLAVLLAVVIPAVVVSLLLPKKYTATASVVVDVKPDPLAAIAYQSMMTPAVMATQIDILQSDRVARRVVRDELVGLRHITTKRAAEGDVEFLKATANAKDRLSELKHPLNQMRHHFIARGIEGARRVVD